MNFLEAHRLVAGFGGGPALPFLLGMSGMPDKLDLFLHAAAAKRGRAAQVRTLPFNTLPQALLAEPAPGETEVFVLLPWDFVAEADWRLGLPTSPMDEALLRQRAQVTADRLARRRGARLLYIPACVPPLFADPAITTSLESWLGILARGIGSALLPAETFSLGSYLANGGAVAGTHLGLVAQAVVERALSATAGPCKVLVTDLDNVMWHGVIGEDGLDGIEYAPEGVGFRHFLYQTFLAKLKREGTLLAAVSRNDEDLANAPFSSGRMMLRAEDFVAVVASYHAKSSQIRQIAEKLNLGLDSFVFVDDSPIEIEEVSAALTGIKVVRFPEKDDALPAFFAEIAALFPRAVVTTEDMERTAMYRRLEGMVPTDAVGADITVFLRELQAQLVIYDRSHGDRTRAVQLINKTNQFNLNGRRVTDEEVGAMLAGGGRLYTAGLSDRTGAHGEILACLMDAAGVVRSLVLSCRVFQRRAEYAFLAWLAGQEGAPRALDFAETPRNEPMRQFIRDPAFGSELAPSGLVRFDAGAFAREHAADVDLFELQAPQPSAAAFCAVRSTGIPLRAVAVCDTE